MTLETYCENDSAINKRIYKKADSAFAAHIAAARKENLKEEYGI